jgi:IS605 OrfB family transposase
MPVITRRVKLDFCVEDKKEIKELYEKMFKWRNFVRIAANWIVTHLYIQDNYREIHYLTEETKIKLANIAKDKDGILTTSRDNTTYQILSKNLKGECPMGMLSGLNTVIAKTYKSEWQDIKYGRRSLRVYRDNIPMPVRFADTSNWRKEEDGNYSFFVYGISFKTWFGRDLSGNELMFDRAMAGEYKLSDSSIKLEKVQGKYKLFFYAVFTFEKEIIKVDPEKVADCYLSLRHPIIIKEKKEKLYTIGDYKEYLHGRLNIKAAIKRTQIVSKYNEGGQGRKKKLEALDRFELAEKKFVDNKMHRYSRDLIYYCIKRGIGKIVLNNYAEVVDETHKDTEESKFLLSSWSYYNLSDKIKYKAAMVGIEVEIPENKPKDKKVL